ncbi:glycosyltransferase family 4 protein [Burkholderiaceae bacterium DAT-1]|nr:glycosyltransferase family 4 protein [Burkholderiaceae bacterium DAT-1]
MAYKILIIHNQYQHKGGEDSVVENEIALLTERGHDVRIYTRDNHEISMHGKIALAINTIWSNKAYSEVSYEIGDFKPDIIHAHNTFPLISPSIYWLAHKSNIPIVQTLHNFRLLCPQAIFLREGKICEDCLGRSPWRGAMRGCYRNSVAQSTVLTAMLEIHRTLGTYHEKVDQYIALSDFSKSKYIAGGLPEKKISVKPNFAPDLNVNGNSTDKVGFLFVGRLSIEKGISVLRDAAVQCADSLFKVAGSGPEDQQLSGIANIKRLGNLSAQEVRFSMQQSKMLILPSICYENMPMTILEAYASAVPVIASRLGALADLVQDGVTGLLFEPNNPNDLVKKIIWANENPDAVSEMGRNARLRYESYFTPEANYQQLIEIYKKTLKMKGIQ